MTDRYPRDTAKVYALSDRVRFGAGRVAKAAADTKSAAPPLPVTVCGSGWYHDAAIRDGDPTRKG